MDPTPDQGADGATDFGHAFKEAEAPHAAPDFGGTSWAKVDGEFGFGTSGIPSRNASPFLAVHDFGASDFGSIPDFDVIPTSSSDFGVIPTSSSDFGVIPTSPSDFGVVPTSSSDFDVIPTSSSDFGGFPTSSSDFVGFPTSSNFVASSSDASLDERLASISTPDPEAATLIQRNLRGFTSRRRLSHQKSTGGFAPVALTTREDRIRVGVRVRPLGEGRGERGERVQINTSLNSITIRPDDSSNWTRVRGEAKQQTFAFSDVFEREDNAALMELVGKPLVESVCEGYNGTLLAYGQTGSGKTFTIGELTKIGTESEGVAHRMIRELFARQHAGAVRSFHVSVQYFQIYLDRVFDLLLDAGAYSSSPAPKLQLREDKSRGVYVDGAQSLVAASTEECLALISKAASNLKFAATQMNRHSSRSHSVCRLTVELKHADVGLPSHAACPPPDSLRCTPIEAALDLQNRSPASDPTIDGAPPNLASWRRASLKLISETLEKQIERTRTTKAVLTLCDLAGSEDVGRSGAVGISLAEAQKINTSLLALGNVIAALTSSKQGENSHVPFRDSVLTRILQESFGGNCKTSLVVCISPASADVTETLSSLRFAGRAKRVKNVARQNATIEASSRAAAELAESLQMHLDTAQQLLQSARERSEARAARCILMAFRFNRARDAAVRQLEQSEGMHNTALHEATRVRHEAEAALKADRLAHGAESAALLAQLERERERAEATAAAASAALEQQLQSERERAEAAAAASAALEQQLQSERERAEAAAAAALAALEQQLKSERERAEAAAAASAALEHQLQSERERAEAAAAALAALEQQLKSERERAEAAAAASAALEQQLQSERERAEAAAAAASAALEEQLKSERERAEAAAAAALAALEEQLKSERERAEAAAAASAALKQQLQSSREYALAESDLSRDYAQQHALAEARGLKAEAEAREMHAQLDGLRAQVERTHAQLRAEHSAALAHKRAEMGAAVEAARVEALASRAEEMEAARVEIASSRAEVEAARAEALASRAEVEAARAEALASRAEVEAARAEALASRAEEMEASRVEIASSRAEMEAARTEALASRAEVEELQLTLKEAAEKGEAAFKAALEAAVAQVVEAAEKDADLKIEISEARWQATLAAKQAQVEELQEALGASRDIQEARALAAAQEQGRRAEEEEAKARVEAKWKATLEGLKAAQQQKAAGEARLGEALSAARMEAAEALEAALAATRSQAQAEANAAASELTAERDAHVAALVQRTTSLLTAEFDAHLAHQRNATAAAEVAEANARADAQAVLDASAEQRVMAEVAAAELAAATHALRAVARSDLESAVEAVRRELSREHEVSLKAATETARVEAAMDSERQCRLRVDAEAALGTALDELTVARHELSRAEVARLQHALDAASATHEAATHELRRELQHAHGSAVERTRSLEATIAELKAAHAAALTKVRSAHEASVKAERDARAEAERQRDVAVERARADSEGARAEAERQQHMHASAMMSEGARAEAERQQHMHASALARVEATHAAALSEAAERVRALETALVEQRASSDTHLASLERAYAATKLSERQLREQLQEQVSETTRLEADNERLAGEAKRWRADLGRLEAQLHGAAEATIAKLREELSSLHGRCERAERQAALLPLTEARADEASRAQAYWMEQQRSVQRELEQQQQQQEHAVAMQLEEMSVGAQLAQAEAASAARESTELWARQHEQARQLADENTELRARLHEQSRMVNEATAFLEHLVAVPGTAPPPGTARLHEAKLAKFESEASKSVHRTEPAAIVF
ncbi:kinesin-like protein kif21b isoform 4 [Chrysochromulina tobinii]|uniref:Kinesin-like protein kif21b isoform 4 n=1 Tax=Chrysochromulina tobinii TaxID=1460289 RepID=A0A0M0K2T2_9EUKA|nr:kinesin-like protein kif21b isoform 4 [Chrysochromulina tobinii]|eukprot:KOO32902.1 kinesin-like protein kif21b isoform 4 [Chrysochromulina sp. CCMP291]